MIGVHVRFVLPYVVGLQGVGLKRGRAMARAGPGESRFGPTAATGMADTTYKLGVCRLSLGCLL